MNIATAIKQLARQNGQSGACISICQVVAVDTDARTIDVQPLDDGAPILGVNLQANQEGKVGVVQIPKADSYVVVGMLDGYTAGVCLLCEEVEKVEVKVEDMSIVVTEDGIVMNDGGLGGMVKVEDLTTRLNTIEQDINSLKTAMAGWTPVAQDGGSALKVAISVWAGSQLTLTQRGDYENDKIKQ